MLLYLTDILANIDNGEHSSEVIQESADEDSSVFLTENHNKDWKTQSYKHAVCIKLRHNSMCPNNGYNQRHIKQPLPNFEKLVILKFYSYK